MTLLPVVVLPPSVCPSHNSNACQYMSQPAWSVPYKLLVDMHMSNAILVQMYSAVRLDLPCRAVPGTIAPRAARTGPTDSRAQLAAAVCPWPAKRRCKRQPCPAAGGIFGPQSCPHAPATPKLPKGDLTDNCNPSHHWVVWQGAVQLCCASTLAISAHSLMPCQPEPRSCPIL